MIISHQPVDTINISIQIKKANKTKVPHHVSSYEPSSPSWSYPYSQSTPPPSPHRHSHPSTSPLSPISLFRIRILKKHDMPIEDVWARMDFFECIVVSFSLGVHLQEGRGVAWEVGGDSMAACREDGVGSIQVQDGDVAVVPC